MISSRIPDTLVMIGLTLIFGPILLSKFLDLKKWGCLLPILGILFVGFRFKFINDIIVVKQGKKTENMYSFYNEFDYKFHDGIVSKINTSGNVLINDSGEYLYIESVKYGNFEENFEENKIINLPIHSFVQNITIDYYFEEPPQSIYQKSTESKIKYWLHN